MQYLSRDAKHGPNDCVTAHSMGGLGNQLFIYAAGLAAAKASGVKLWIDVSMHQSHDRPFVLDTLGLPAVNVLARRADGSQSRMRDRLLSPPRGCTFVERSFRYDPDVLDQRTGGCLYGYFQSWRYLQSVETELRSGFAELRARRAVQPGFSSARKHVNIEGAIALHVRRGDYLAPSSLGYHGLPRADYYARAVSVLRDMGMSGPLVLFSDDIELARGELSSLGEIIIPETDLLEPIDELLLMSEASALVTANSSFSWWAGWLAAGQGSRVICPRPWFDNVAIDTRDLLPPDWLTLGRDADVFGPGARKIRGSSGAIRFSRRGG